MQSTKTRWLLFIVVLSLCAESLFHPASPCETSETYLRWHSGTNYLYYDELFEPRDVVLDVDSAQGVLVVATESWLRTFRITSPGVLEEADSYALTGVFDVNLVLDGSTLFALTDNTLRTFDLDPTGNLTPLGTLENVGDRYLAKQGSHVYVTSGLGLRVIDVSVPASPVQVGFAAADASRIVVNGDWAYVSNLNFSAWAVDILDPTNPVYNGGAFVGGAGQLLGLGILDDHLYVAKSTGGLRVFDLAVPGSPNEVGSHPGHASRVAVDDGRVAVTSNGLKGAGFLDASDPTNPQFRGYFRTFGIDRWTVQDGFAYVAAGYDGLQVLDLREEANPAPIATASEFSDPRGIASLSNEVLLGLPNSLEVVSVNDPLNPVGVGSFGFTSIRSVAASGSQAYVVDTNGFHVVDVSDPSTPSLLATIPEPDYGQIILTGNRAYVWDHNRMATVDVTDPEEPLLITETNPAKFIDGVAASGNTVYIMTSFELFSTIIAWDYADPLSPSFLESTSLLFAEGLALAGDQLIVGGYEELSALDAETLTLLGTVGDSDFGSRGLRSTEAGVFAMNGSYHQFDVLPELAYVSTGSTPVADVRDLLVLGDYLFAIDEGGLYVFDVPCQVANTDGVPPSAQSALRAFPNPSGAGVWLENLELPSRVDRGDSVLEVFDSTGRRVRSLSVAAGEDRVFWDGRDETGRRVSSGVFLTRWSGSGGVSSGTVRIVR